MRVLITGGAGFIGSALIRHLIGATRDVSVLNVDKLTYASNLQSLAVVQVDPRYRLLQADICDRDAMREVVSNFEPDGIIHLAAETHVDRSIDNPAEFITTNIVGTHTLLEAARDYLDRQTSARRDAFRFLHVSTDEVYGSLGAEGFFNEQTVYDPSSPYSASKAAADHLVMAWHHTYGMSALVSNCSNNYGPYQLPEKLVPLVILNGIVRKPIPVYGDGQNIRDWLHVDDHARALHLIFERGRPGQKYNVGGRNERTNLEVVHRICDLLDAGGMEHGSHHDLVAFVADRPGHDRRYAIDASRLEKELGWRAQETFESGIGKTVRWYIENEEWWAPLRAYADQRRGVATKAPA